MAGTILVFAEQRDGQLKRSVLELLGLAKDLGGEVHALVVGSGVDAVADSVASQGAAKVWVADADELRFASPEPYAARIAAAIDAVKPELVLLPASAMGRDLAPRVAARGGFPYLSECLSLGRGGGGFEARKSMYGGKAFGTWEASGATVVATVKPGAHAPAATGGTGEKAPAPAPAESKNRARVVEVVQGAGEVEDLQEAEIIVSGGRGLRGPENFSLVRDLAQALGGAVGASRAVVDAGWIEHAHQVGQTGVSVSPKLYIACGISGAIQHLAGMRSAKCIVAINKDADAPIFKAADYGVVGDLFEIVPLLAEEIRKQKGA